MFRGYIKLYRKLYDDELFKEKRTFSKFEAWIDILLMASHCKTKFVLGYEVIELEEGQFITSQKKLSKRWGWSRGKVSRFLELLENTQKTVQQTDTLKTLITVCNYKLYQGEKKGNGTTNGQAPDTLRTGTGQVPDTIKNSKNDKNVKKEDKTRVKIDYQKYFDSWNQVAKENGLPQIEKMNADRKAKIKTRDRDGQFEEKFQRALKEIPDTPFVLGAGPRGWKIFFDWLITNDTNIYKILEGNFKNGKPEDRPGKLPTSIDPNTDYSIPTDRGHGFTS